MSNVAALIADMVREGVSAEIIGRVAAALAEREPVVVRDEQADRRRAADRERKRNQSGIPQNSAESTEPKKESTKEKNIPLSPPYGGTFPKPNPSESFSTFWQAYPNKTGRPKAETAYGKALRRASAEEILAGLGRAVRSDRRFAERQFTPHPQSWLNADGWADEHDEAPASAKPDSPSAWDAEKWRKVVGYCKRHGQWDAKLGPPPDDPKTLCPPDLRELWTQRDAA